MPTLCRSPSTSMATPDHEGGLGWGCSPMSWARAASQKWRLRMRSVRMASSTRRRRCSTNSRRASSPRRCTSRASCAASRRAAPCVMASASCSCRGGTERRLPVARTGDVGLSVVEGLGDARPLAGGLFVTCDERMLDGHRCFQVRVELDNDEWRRRRRLATEPTQRSAPTSPSACSPCSSNAPCATSSAQDTPWGTLWSSSSHAGSIATVARLTCLSTPQPNSTRSSEPSSPNWASNVSPMTPFWPTVSTRPERVFHYRTA